LRHRQIKTPEVKTSVFLRGTLTAATVSNREHIMTKPMMKVLAIAFVTMPAIMVSAIAQQPAIKRTVLRSIDYPAGYTTVTAIVEIAPGTCAGRHTHPGDRQRLRHTGRLCAQN
jgi:hypothetical protein